MQLSRSEWYNRKGVFSLSRQERDIRVSLTFSREFGAWTSSIICIFGAPLLTIFCHLHKSAWNWRFCVFAKVLLSPFRAFVLRKMMCTITFWKCQSINPRMVEYGLWMIEREWERQRERKRKRNKNATVPCECLGHPPGLRVCLLLSDYT